jgi:flavin-dependent dehydrogenase
METSVDVVVVGAGLAGLTAARRLEAEDRSVAVVEAALHVGGRVLARTLLDDPRIVAAPADRPHRVGRGRDGDPVGRVHGGSGPVR